MKTTLKKETRTKFIEATSKEAFEREMNEALKGLSDPKIQVYGKYAGAIIYTEHLYEEDQRTVADFFEEAGCGASCSECSHFQQPKDGRVKWIICEHAHRRVSGRTNACDFYYLERRNNVPETGTTNERDRLGHERAGELPENLVVEDIPQTERRYTLLPA